MGCLFAPVQDVPAPGLFFVLRREFKVSDALLNAAEQIDSLRSENLKLRDWDSRNKQHIHELRKRLDASVREMEVLRDENASLRDELADAHLSLQRFNRVHTAEVNLLFDQAAQEHSEP